jgi:hypothetical protein
MIPPWGLVGVYEGLFTVVGFRAVLEEVNQNKEDSFIYVSPPLHISCSGGDSGLSLNDPMHWPKCGRVLVLELTLQPVLWT